MNTQNVKEVKTELERRTNKESDMFHFIFMFGEKKKCKRQAHSTLDLANGNFFYTYANQANAQLVQNKQTANQPTRVCTVQKRKALSFLEIDKGYIVCLEGTTRVIKLSSS